MPDWEPYTDLQKTPMPEEDVEHNERWKRQRKIFEEREREAKEKVAKAEARQAEIEEAILEIARAQKTILTELAWIREKLTYTVNR